MLRVGCWAGRLVLDCTVCEWQDPAADSMVAEDSRDLPDLLRLGATHVAEVHSTAARPAWLDAVERDLRTSLRGEL